MSSFNCYPSAYEEMLRRFQDGLPARLGPFAFKQARAVRLKLYSYKAALYRAPPTDTAAQELADIFRDIYISLTKGEEGTYVEFVLDPVVEAFRSMKEAVIGQVLRLPIDMDSEGRDYRFHVKRDDELFAEWREWDERIKGAKQWGASLSVADEFRRAAASELRRRGLAVPSE